MLPDLLAPDLKVVFCGTAAGRKSADLGHYYAGRGNKFWKTLFTIGLTPNLLLPSQFSELINWKIVEYFDTFAIIIFIFPLINGHQYLFFA